MHLTVSTHKCLLATLFVFCAAPEKTNSFEKMCFIVAIALFRFRNAIGAENSKEEISEFKHALPQTIQELIMFSFQVSIHDHLWHKSGCIDL